MFERMLVTSSENALRISSEVGGAHDGVPTGFSQKGPNRTVHVERGLDCERGTLMATLHSGILRELRNAPVLSVQSSLIESRLGGCQHSLVDHIEAQLRGHDGALRVLSGNKPPVDHGIL